MYVAAWIYGIPDAVEKNEVEDLVADLLSILGKGFKLQNPGHDATVFVPRDMARPGLGEELVVKIERMASQRDDPIFVQPDLHRIAVSVGDHLCRFIATHRLRHCQKVVVKIEWARPAELLSHVSVVQDLG